jgi:hypothetical protein
MSISVESRIFPTTRTKMLTPQEGMNTAMSSQADNTLALADVLDRGAIPSEEAQEIVDMFDSVRRFGNSTPNNLTIYLGP